MSKEAQSAARQWMRLHAREHIDPLTGELNHTKLAEATARHFDSDHWLEEGHWLWDLPFEVAQVVAVENPVRETVAKRTSYKGYSYVVMVYGIGGDTASAIIYEGGAPIHQIEKTGKDPAKAATTAARKYIDGRDKAAANPRRHNNPGTASGLVGRLKF